MEKQKTFQEISEKLEHRGLMKDVMFYIKESKKWWLLPFILVFILMGIFIFLSGTGVAPFVYTLF